MSRFHKFPLALLVCFVMTALVDKAGAGALSVVHTFTGGVDGAFPHAPLLWGPYNYLYGTTTEGGASGTGTIFRVDPTTNSLTTLYNFTSINNIWVNGDGAEPTGQLVFDTEGNAWGVTWVGGTYGSGTIFAIRTARPPYIESVVHSFSPGTGDGSMPVGGVVWDSARTNLYGTTGGGGAGGCGVVFRYSITGTYTLLHSFTCQPGDGSYPAGALWSDANGNLYGSTENGGSVNSGVIYKVTPSGVETVLYSFCSLSNCLDGELPYGDLIGDAAGNLYGTTQFGGKYGAGTVYEFSSNGTYKVLRSFTGGSDGGDPSGGLFLDSSSGNLFGTTNAGGIACNSYGTDGGVVFKLYPNGKYSVLHDFTNGADGSLPIASLGAQSGNVLYGTTYGQGCSSYGSLFSVETNY